MVDMSGMVIDDHDAVLMAVGTALGGLQTIAIRKLTNEPARTGTSMLTSTSGIAAIGIGLTFIGVGVATRTGMIDFNKDVATVMLGYGLSAVISLVLMYVTSTTFSSTSKRISTRNAYT